MSTQADIFYTLTDESPALATASLLPILQYFAGSAYITIGIKDISLAGRIIANFPDNLTEEQKQPDALIELGQLVNKPEANIIKLPNISASIPQLQAAIKELQTHGFDVPDYPEDPENDDERVLQKRYATVLGSAVNPVLRQGNAKRHPILAAKEYAQSHPHEVLAWESDTPSHVSHMPHGDFFGNEKSTTTDSEQNVRIEFIAGDGQKIILKEQIPLEKNEIVDATYMSVSTLRSYIKEQMQDAKDKNILFSVHLKATMMKVSDPEIFGHIVEVFFEDVFTKHTDLFEELGINSNNGIGDIYSKISGHAKEQEIIDDMNQALSNGPQLMTVDVEKNITNLHVPNKVIIDASMPPIIRWGGKTTGPDGQEHDMKAVIPDTTYAVFHKAMAEDVIQNGTFDPATMGSVCNIGLMAQKAEEYGSHDKTFMAPNDGTIHVISDTQNIIHEHKVGKGDIWRMCQAKDAPIKNWIELAVNNARLTGAPTVFWLDKNRAHDAQIIKKVKAHLDTLDTDGLEIDIMSPQEATVHTNKLLREGKNVNAVTGNVLRDHLTDMYPILEVATSAKMVSEVPLMNGGGMYETGAGGSAPDHVEQVQNESHLRWNSLGEFAAIAASLEQVARSKNNDKAAILAQALKKATTKLLNEDKSPSRKTGELDSKGSHFYLAFYWAEELAEQTDNAELKEYFVNFFNTLKSNETKILDELLAIEGKKADLGGYYHMDARKVESVMRPSATFNAALSS